MYFRKFEQPRIANEEGAESWWSKLVITQFHGMHVRTQIDARAVGQESFRSSRLKLRPAQYDVMCERI